MAETQNNIYADRRVLITGGTGMVGRALLDYLRELGATVRVVSLDDPDHWPEDVEFLRLDLTDRDGCLQACRDIEFVFHLAGVKGGVGIGQSQAAKFFEVNALLNLHMLQAAYETGVTRYLFTSTLGVYPDAEIFKEGDIWDKPPHRSDWYGAWGKRIGELQCEAYLEQYGYKTSVVRPAAIYGPYDNFDPGTAMVVPALIGRVCSGEDPLVVWGDGSPIRDFIYSKDCARGMLLAMEKNLKCDPVNLGSGVGVSIKELVDTILRHAPNTPRVGWDTSKPVGNKKRLMDMTKARRVLGFEPQYSLDEGIRETVEWHLANKDHQSRRYSAFTSARSA